MRKMKFYFIEDKVERKEMYELFVRIIEPQQKMLVRANCIMKCRVEKRFHIE